MKATHTIFAAASAILVFGCTPSAKPSPEPSKPGTGGAVEAPKPKEPSAELKHGAFELLGFGRLEPYTYSFVKMQGVKPAEGSQTTELVEVTPEAAKYQVLRTEGLSELGSEDFEVRKDGVYSTRMSLGTLEEPMLIMPSDISVGKTWSGSFVTTDVTGRKITFKVNHKGEKEEKLTVKAGDFDSVLVTTTGSITIEAEGKPTTGTVSTKTWYAKGVGQLKMVMELKKSDGSNVKSSVELVKIGK